MDRPLRRTLAAFTAFLSALPNLVQAQPGTRAGLVSDTKPFAGRYYTEIAYVLPSSVSLNGVEFGDVDTTEAQISYQASIRASDRASWIAGVELRGTWFDVPGTAPIPDGLYETSLRLGAIWRFAEDWTFQTILSPGLYSDLKDIDDGDFNLPGVALFFWQLQERLQLIGGAAVNLRRDVPVIPALGARWGFADRWTLLAVYPTPRVEYAASDSVTVFAGAELIRTAYRVAEDFGDRFGRPELNDEDLSYNEWRVGAGLRWRIAPAFTVSLDGGWMGDREFNFDEVDVDLEGDGAPYVQLSVGGTF